MSKPDFMSLWNSFPDHERYPTLTALHTNIGGELARNVNVRGFGPKGNTCGVRMSKAFNYANMPLSSKLITALQLHALVGADRKAYLFRVSEMRAYIARALGVTPISVTRHFETAFAGKRGIIAFSVKGWDDATGHLALWNGTQFREPSHDDFRNLKDDPATPLVEPHTSRMTLWPL